MRIRSLTLGLDAAAEGPKDACQRAGPILGSARLAFERAGFDVQTTRLCTQSAHGFLTPDAFGAWVGSLESVRQAEGVDYFAVGNIRLANSWSEQATREAVVEAICATESVFSSVQLAPEGKLDYRAARASARIILELARQTPMGFGNLRFAASANCRPNTPFFPVAFHAGGQPRLSIALQAADLLVEALSPPGSTEEMAQRLTDRLQEEGEKIQDLGQSEADRWGIEYAGLDLSPAPFPSTEESVAAGLEALGVDAFGAAGTLTAVSIVTRALKASTLKHCGFSGIMLPVLEDGVLAQRASEGLISVSDLLLYSAVCGTGLDTVPLPGDASEGELAALLLDVATLAVSLDKPLTARLFPVPGKKAGDLTDFSFPYFANTRILSLKGYGAQRLFDRDTLTN